MLEPHGIDTEARRPNKVKGIPMTIVNDKYGFCGGLDVTDYVERVVTSHHEKELDHILRYI